MLNRVVQEHWQDGLKGHRVHGHQSIGQQDQGGLRTEHIFPAVLLPGLVLRLGARLTMPQQRSSLIF